MMIAHAQSTFRAKVALEDGTPLSTSPQIIPAPSQRLMANCRVVTIFGDGTVEYAVNWRSRPYDASTVDACEVTIRLKGYRTVTATLRTGSTVVLKRTGDTEGSKVSVTALKAPEPAQKAFGKGVAAMTDRKWSAAQKDFEHAVEIYPEYAAAWSDLGEVLLQQSNQTGARSAWERAIQADPTYIKPYVQAARLALQEGRNEEAALTAERAVAMNPVEFPSIYFFSAAANYNLKHFDVAEKSALRAIDLDPNHEIPRAHLLLGSVLALKGDRTGALQHMRKYLELSPHATDADAVNALIAKIESNPR
jgi:tetratricopeptide (TPR) repeat protein